MALVCLSTIISVFVLNVSERGCCHHPVPACISRVARFSSRFLFIQRSFYNKKIGATPHYSEDHDKTFPVDGDMHMVARNTGNAESTTLESCLYDTLSDLGIIMLERSGRAASKNSSRDEWLLLASVLDRLFLIVFILLTVAISCFTLVMRPQTISVEAKII